MKPSDFDSYQADVLAILPHGKKGHTGTALDSRADCAIVVNLHGYGQVSRRRSTFLQRPLHATATGRARFTNDHRLLAQLLESGRAFLGPRMFRADNQRQFILRDGRGFQRTRSRTLSNEADVGISGFNGSGGSATIRNNQ